MKDLFEIFHQTLALQCELVLSIDVDRGLGLFKCARQRDPDVGLSWISLLYVVLGDTVPLLLHLIFTDFTMYAFNICQVLIEAIGCRIQLGSSN